jgi:hypothetical protein
MLGRLPYGGQDNIKVVLSRLLSHAGSIWLRIGQRGEVLQMLRAFRFCGL